jgi:hypothetical protein
MNDLSIMTDEELSDFIADTIEVLGETETQHRSECALYGDSWPGAQIQIQNIRDSLARQEAEWDRRHPAPAAPPVDDYEAGHDDSPF